MIQAFFILWAWALFGEIGSAQIKSLQNTLSPWQKGLLLFVAQTLVSLPFFFISPSLPQRSWAILIFFTGKVIGSILLQYFCIKTIEEADRTTNTQYTVLLIPLLICTDRIMWYISGRRQLIGAGLIVARFLRSLQRHDLSHKWLPYILITICLSAGNTILFKYGTNHFGIDPYLLNSAMSFCWLISIGIYLYFNNWRQHLVFPFQKKFMLFALTNGISSTLGSSTYTVLPPSLIVAGKRIWYLFRGTLSGVYYFHERHLRQKYFNMAFLMGCIICMQAPTLLWQRADIIANMALFKTDIAGVPAYIPEKIPDNTRKQFIPYEYY